MVGDIFQMGALGSLAFVVTVVKGSLAADFDGDFGQVFIAFVLR